VPPGLAPEFADLIATAGEPALRLVHDPVLAGEAYRLRIDATGAVAAYATPAGARHALRTLRQLVRATGGMLPALAISDAPAVPVRGIMLDCARDRIPTIAELEDIVDLVAALKGNHLQLYTEHNFAYAGHETVWRDADPLTPDELRRLDAHCRSRGVVLAANQNCFGHFERWFAHPAYAHLAEWSDPAARPGPQSLNPTDPRSLALVRDLLDQLLPCFASELVNIGCDETQDVGQGRSRAAVAARGYAAVYGEHVGAVCRHCLDRGRQPLFWADVDSINSCRVPRPVP
jgi:hypothetical protein